MRGKKITCILALLLLILAVGFARHQSPVELYGSGGRGIVTEHSVDRLAVISCFLEIADIDRDTRISVIELRRVLKAGQYITAMEKLFANLDETRILRHCDTNKDGMLSLTELEALTCLNTAQIEAIARYICSRVKHIDMGYDEYRRKFDEANVAIKSGESLWSVFKSGVKKEDAIINPHAGRLSRLELPTDQNDVIGAQLDPGLIYAFFLSVFVIIIVVVIALIVTALG